MPDEFENIEGIFVLREINESNQPQSSPEKRIRKRRSESDLHEISNRKGNFQIVSPFLILRVYKIENSKGQLKFKPMEILSKKRTKDKSTLTGPWFSTNFDGPYFNEVRHAGKVSTFMIDEKPTVLSTLN